jgi:hypothetical protein
MHVLRDVVLPLLGLCLLLAVWIAQCSGPTPELVGQPRVIAPEDTGQPYLVEATVRNMGRGHGEARVTLRLVDTSSGDAFQQQEPVDLQNGETVRVSAEFHVPAGNYTARAEVQYPPQ